MTKVSVIVNCYNGEEYLREALDSIFAQTYQEWEIIFWDNCSKDHSAEIARSYGEKLKYHRSEENVPLGQARNMALAQATGDVIAFLDCDDLWDSRKLEKLLPLFAANPQVGLVFSDTWILNQSDGSRYRYFEDYPRLEQGGRIFSKLFHPKGFCVAMSSAMVRKEAMEPFDERFRYAEDFELFTRIAYRWECDFSREALTTYRIHSHNLTQKSYDLSIHERKMTIEKFASLFPGFEADNRNLLKINRQYIRYKEGVSLWRDGRLKEARALFLGNLTHPESLASLVVSFLPFQRLRSWREGLRNLRRTFR